MMESYTDGKYEYFVGRGLSLSHWMVLRRLPGMGSHRVKSKFLPERKTRHEAQVDLDQYATKKKYRALPIEFSRI